jgi:hypothetical protein
MIGWLTHLQHTRAKNVWFVGILDERLDDFNRKVFSPQVKREGWREQGVLAVAIDDERLSWPERELVRQLGEKLYGKREEVANV